MKKLVLSVLLGSALLSANTFAADDEVVAIVNKHELTEEDFQFYAKSRIGVKPGAHLPEDKRGELLEELINRELIYQQAVEDGFDQDPAIKRQIEEQVRNLIAGIRIRRLLEETPVSEEELQKIYEQQVSGPASMEYRARHILLKTEDEALNIIDKLNRGGNFVELAKQHSTGPSAQQGGDLGWFALTQMVKPFSDAVAKLKPGNYSKRAVQTKFGWHVIFLEKERKVAAPTFESMQQQLIKVVQNQIINDYIDSLKDKADIQFK